jgi:23S rRNA (cytidine1920-2'-O)/16S rRNA (cytidine1409-2'-O)-methyltransferase
MNDDDRRYVGRGGRKLEAALDAFNIDLMDAVVADLGANVGGFTDCLLQRGARKVYAVETGYGVLEWKLRNDARVTVMERTNALHVDLPEPVQLVTIDVGWTPMRLILPKAMELLLPGGRVCALLKPQYEAERSELEGGVVPHSRVEAVVERTLEALRESGLAAERRVDSPITGAGGNREFFIYLTGKG